MSRDGRLFTLSWQERKLLLRKCLSGVPPPYVRKESLVVKTARKRIRHGRKIGVREKRQRRHYRDKRKKYFGKFGLDRDGKLKKATPVFFSRIPSGAGFCDHAIFPRSIPFAVLSTAPWTILQELHDFLDSVQVIIDKEPGLRTHLNANKGVQLGLSVVGGGRHRNSIQWGRFMKNRPNMRSTFIRIIQRLLHSVYGSTTWYRHMLQVTTKLNKDSGDFRTIPGVPFSGIWFTQVTDNLGTHRDGNSVGVSVVMSTKHVAGGHLCLQKPNGDWIEHLLMPGLLVAGRWAEWVHCNSNVCAPTTRSRRSIIFYLDRAAFSARYRYIKPRGYIES